MRWGDEGGINYESMDTRKQRRNQKRLDRQLATINRRLSRRLYAPADTTYPWEYEHNDTGVHQNFTTTLPNGIKVVAERAGSAIGIANWRFSMIAPNGAKSKYCLGVLVFRCEYVRMLACL